MQTPPVSPSESSRRRLGRRRGPEPLCVGIGAVLAGKYRVERVLGEGGMGVVVAATHIHVDRLVALKIMRPEMSDDAPSVTRFLREARASARLGGEHVARVLDVVTVEPGVPCIVMEYLDGEDLAAAIARRGRLPLEEAADCVLQACAGLAQAHAAAIVHRDLKPANLFLTTNAAGSACVKILDFGISKFVDTRDQIRVTQASDTMGSPLYVAPEQMISARDVDARADVWALGVILYELTTGRSPFHGRTATQICANVLQARYRPPSELAPELPTRFEAIVARCLTRELEQRYQSVAELADDLAAFGPPRSRPLPRAKPAPAATPAAAAAPAPRAARRWAWIGAALAASALALALSPLVKTHPHVVAEALTMGSLIEDASSLLNPERLEPAPEVEDSPPAVVPELTLPPTKIDAERTPPRRLSTVRARKKRLSGEL